MFAKSVVDSDAFLDMPGSAQLLYFHLAMRADDDGFVNKPKSILRISGCKDDDLKLLILKNFVIPFESGIVVITHWKLHNYIRNDRYKETEYKEEKSTLTIDENNRYTIGIPTVTHLVDRMDTQVRIGKDSIDKNNIYMSDSDESDGQCYSSDFLSFWNKYPKKVGKGAAYKLWKKLKISKSELKNILNALEWQIKSDQWQRESGQYIPNPSTYLNQRRWEDEPKTPQSQPGTLETFEMKEFVL